MAETTPDANEPKVVYHYTSMDTMKKIVDSESIWATSLNYLNDDSEGDHYVKLIKERIPVCRETHSLDEVDIS